MVSRRRKRRKQKKKRRRRRRQEGTFTMGDSQSSSPHSSYSRPDRLV